MPDHLFLILGAGASWDCASPNVANKHEEWHPPLTAELFRGAPFERILNFYPPAEAAASDINRDAREPVALETFLRETLRDSAHSFRRQQFRAIPLYLQHLLFEVSAWDPAVRRGYTVNPDNYNRLISVTLELEEAVFLTLNYDTLLDRRLFQYAPLQDMASYIADGNNWSLIKLHGSVNWGRLVLNDWEIPDNDPYCAETIRRIGDDLEVDDGIMLRPAADVRGLRHEGATTSAGARGVLYYPALAAPLGPGDELVCPPEHVEHLRRRVTAYDGLNLLVVGYSALDNEVLRLFRESGNGFRSLSVVSHNADAAERTAQIIEDEVPLLAGAPARLFTEGFDAFARGDDLRELVASLP